MSVFRHLLLGLIIGNSVGASLYIGVKCGTWYGMYVSLALVVLYVGQWAIGVGRGDDREQG